MVTNNLVLSEIQNINEATFTKFQYLIDEYSTSTPADTTTDQKIVWAGTAFPAHLSTLTHACYHIKKVNRQAPYLDNYNGLWYTVGGLETDQVIVSKKFASQSTEQGQDSTSLQFTFYLQDYVWVSLDNRIFVLDPATGNVVVEYNMYQILLTFGINSTDPRQILVVGKDGNVYTRIYDDQPSLESVSIFIKLNPATQDYDVIIPLTSSGDYSASWTSIGYIVAVDPAGTPIFADWGITGTYPLYRGVDFNQTNLTSYATIPLAANTRVIDFNQHGIGVPNVTPSKLIIQTRSNVVPLTQSVAIFDYDTLGVTELFNNGTGFGVNALEPSIINVYANQVVAYNVDAPSLPSQGDFDYPAILLLTVQDVTNVYEFSTDATIDYGTAVGELYDASTPLTNPMDLILGQGWVDHEGKIYTLSGQSGSLDNYQYSIKLLGLPTGATTPGSAVPIGRQTMTVCRCTRITPRSATAPTLGFTDHDCDIEIDGLVYKSKGTFEPSAVDLSSNLSVDNTSLRAVFTDDSIDPDLVARGFYDGAEIVISIVDWYQPPTSITDTNQVIILTKGELGNVSTTNIGYELEARSIETRLNKSVSRVTQVYCPYKFGDSDCGVDLVGTGNTNLTATVTSVTARNEFSIGTTFTQSLNYGIIEFTSGANAGIQREILNYSAPVIKLFESFPAPIQVGDTVTITAGCDRTLSGGCSLYNNVVNFGGFPQGGNWMPGSDFIYSNPIDNA